MRLYDRFSLEISPRVLLFISTMVAIVLFFESARV